MPATPAGPDLAANNLWLAREETSASGTLELDCNLDSKKFFPVQAALPPGRMFLSLPSRRPLGSWPHQPIQARLSGVESRIERVLRLGLTLLVKRGRMHNSHHAEVFLQARRSVGPYCANFHHSNNKRCISYSRYRDASALPIAIASWASRPSLSREARQYQSMRMASQG
jgi:hypothetical protein